MNNLTKLLWATVATFSGLSQTAFTQDAGSDGSTVLSTIVVTPLRRDSVLSKATSAVTVIDRQAIQKSAATDLPSLLKATPGIAVTNTGGLGSSSSIQLRGMATSQTLILVNGVRTASATLGSTTLAGIPLDSVERVEIAKGPHSAVWGADAIGGVINIITKSGASSCPDGKALCGSVTAGFSHPWGAFTSMDVRGSKDGTSFAFGANAVGTRGYNFMLPWATDSGYEPDDDGFRRGSFNFSLSKDFDWGRVYTDGLFSRGRSQFDATFDYGFGSVTRNSNETDYTNFSGKVGARFDHAEDWSSTVEVSQGFDKSSSFRDGVSGGEDYITRRTGVMAKTEKSFETGDFDHNVLFGGEYFHEGITTNAGSYAVTGRDLSAVFGQYSLETGSWHLDSGLRYDYNEQFNDAVTYNLGAAYDVTPDLTLRASYGTGFRAPTFNDLYYPSSGNPNLTPERSKTAEIGLAWQPDIDTKFEGSLYRTWLKDGIAWAPGGGGLWSPYNIGRARVTGLELSASRALNDQLTVNGGFTWLDPRDETTGKYITYRDRFKASAGASYQATEAFSLTTTALYGSGAYTDSANTNRLGGYVTFDVTALYALDKQSSFKLSVENLLDKEYSTNKGYQAPGRTINLSFTRNF